MYVVNLNSISILEQLQLEEALLRSDENNWCLINSGVQPAIVMGISGKAENLLNVEKVHQDKITVIKRFSGGGTVYVDENTIFVTFICNSSDFSFPPQPHPILEWSYKLYKKFFPFLELKENDYTFNDKKVGGNAQYIQKGRWLHHSSFLWDYDVEKMDYLLLPEKRPKYRSDRPHSDFLCSLRPVYGDKAILINDLTSHIRSELKAFPNEGHDFSSIMNRPHRRSTALLEQ